MRYSVFDLEIKSSIGPDCGWGDYHKMGISVGCAYDSKTQDYSAFMDDNIQELGKHLEEVDMVVGFNIKGFDIPLLEATLGRTLKFKGIYDILEESRKAVGWMPGDRWPSGLKLDDHLLGTFGADFMKTAAGAEAPIMWQHQRIGELVSYCLADVRRELALFDRIQKGLPVTTKTHGEKWLRKLPAWDIAKGPSIAVAHEAQP